MSRPAVAWVIVASCVACVSQKPLGNREACPCAPGWSCDVSQNVCVPVGYDGGARDGGGSTTASYSAAAVQAALANCSLPHGPPDLATTPNDEAARLAGAWVLCPPPATQPATLFSPGIRFEANGDFELLTPEGDGGLTTGTGLLSQGTWGTSCYNVDPTLVPDANARPCSGTSIYGIDVQAHTIGGDDSPTSCFVGAISFETAPARGYVIDEPGEWCSAAYEQTTWDFWLVPLQ